MDESHAKIESLPVISKKSIEADDKPVHEGPKIEVITEGAASNATFVFIDEDHTLGNALRYMLMKNPDVEFSGYTVPHPNENKMNLRVQTTGKPATKVLRKAMKDVGLICRHMNATFEQAVDEFRSMQE
mmetsp:Transcript_42949/g.69688  ORF Transcript_42949/g.69688 Transcript_42949/m.69688 type:complete len:129 (-) Transcript_42949:709-1095(-)|eukprot:CAMPEP_0184644742 /NCGR_PEP_ID=MMETSP0308-20130426/1405_1 /TAXON_ID=38269 /ORGANISM="Gloeochaete witrockiana, Strain SAG 46.84" /LENGTH=128 /DNA_ID=CAMNT_0027073433 /DNA_START=116 /DNA_END=502 /DNA_ORIENTATION=+